MIKNKKRFLLKLILFLLFGTISLFLNFDFSKSYETSELLKEIFDIYMMSFIPVFIGMGFVDYMNDRNNNKRE